MKNFITTTILLLATSSVLSACSVKAGSAAENPAPIVPLGVPGPTVEGTWVSDCEKIYFDEYRRIYVKYAGDSYERIDKRFTEATCKTVRSEKTYRGNFYFTENENNEYYIIEYKQDLGDGWSSLTNEKLYKDHNNNLLYLSNFRVGFDVKKENMILLKPM